MDLETIIKELRHERNRIDMAIEALDGVDHTATQPKHKRSNRRWTPERRAKFMDTLRKKRH